jgi:D-alanine-D-alanine ligase
MSKLRVGLLFGGRSVEHEVSVASATSILSALDPAHYEIRLLAIDHDGRWHVGSPALPPEATVRGEEVVLPAAPGGGALLPMQGDASLVGRQLDVVFPIVHGRGGEDGALQGLLELADVPYVGSGVLSSAVQMDKDVAKRLLRGAGIPVVPWLCLRGAELEPGRRKESARRAIDELGLPLFVKPANSGSSVGISKAKSIEALAACLAEAARYDVKVIVEAGLDAREIEVAVLGNRDPEASVPGEIRTKHEFYDYEAKYVDEDTELLVPAPISEARTEEARALALRAFRILEAEGLARVDFFLEKATEKLFVNELNSLPGFTEASMFPRLWQASGLPYPALLDRLIELALERHRAHQKLETQYRRG